MKPGTKLVALRDMENSLSLPGLTKGKIYKVQSVTDTGFSFYDDIGNFCMFPLSFIKNNFKLKGRGGARKGSGRKAKAPRAKYTVNINQSDLNVARQRHGKLVQRYCVDLIKCLADTPTDHKIEFSVVAKEGEEYF